MKTTLASILLFTAVAGAAPARAQEPASELGVPVPHRLELPGLAPPSPPPVRLVGRIVLSTIVGFFGEVIGAIAGSVPGILVGCIAGAAAMGEWGEEAERTLVRGCMGGAATGAAIGASFATAFAVTRVGDALGGRGGGGWTFFGALLAGGIGIAVDVAIALTVESQRALMAASVTMLVLPTAGAVLGYELSSRRRARPRVVPAVTARRDGATVGVRGSLRHR